MSIPVYHKNPFAALQRMSIKNLKTKIDRRQKRIERSKHTHARIKQIQLIANKKFSFQLVTFTKQIMTKRGNLKKM